MSAAGVGPANTLEAYDATTADALSIFRASLPAAQVTRAGDFVRQPAKARGTPAEAFAGARRWHKTILTVECLIMPAGAEDPEYELESLQAPLCAGQTCCLLRAAE